jgi:hypothetical protein
MKRLLAILLLACAALVAAPAHADGYLSSYGAGGSQYCCGSRQFLSSYNNEGYTGGYSSGYVSGYGYAVSTATPISRKHRDAWETYLRHRWDAERQGSGYDGPISRWTRYANEWYNPQGISLGLPAGSPYICGTYSRAPAACHARTAAYSPMVSDDE